MSGFRTRMMPPEIQTRDTEEKRAARYAGFRIAIRMLAIALVLAEAVLVGPTLPLWAALAGIVYGIDQIRIVLDTHNPCDLVIRIKPDLRHDLRFMGLTIVAVGTGAIVGSGLWFPVWFPARDGYLWWETAEATGRILPSLGSLAYWGKLFMMAGIVWGFWDPLRILDWVYKVESVWTQYRNTTFAPAGVDDVQTPMGTVSSAKGAPKPVQPALPRFASPAPVPASSNGGNGQVHTVVPEGGYIDLE